MLQGKRIHYFHQHNCFIYGAGVGAFALKVSHNFGDHRLLNMFRLNKLYRFLFLSYFAGYKIAKE